MNGFLPANIGTFVTLFMFVAIIPSCTLAGRARRVPRAEDLLHDRRHIRLPVPLPEVPGLVRGRASGNFTSHPVITIVIVVGGAFVLVAPRPLLLAR